MLANDPLHKVIYFRPRELVFLVTHQGQLTQEQLYALTKWINNQSGGACLLPRQVLTFPATPPVDDKPSDDQEPPPPQISPRDPFSLIFTDVAGVDDDPDQLLELIRNLDQVRDNQPVDGLKWDVVSPNWLTSGTSQPGATGGPGGKPMPFEDTVEVANSKYQFQLDKLSKSGLDLSHQGKGVDVAILDTAPCLHALVDAYNFWEGKNWQIDYTQHPHPLIRTLLGPNGPLRVYPATYDDLLRMGSIQADAHQYLMTDHGLFVAGIVHSIAPLAKIHLIEVLNPYGIGDLESVAKGLAQVVQRAQRYPGRPLVVNCSLVLNIPLAGEHCHDGHGRVLEQKILNSDQQWLAHQGDTLGYICDLSYALRSRVIAAAGNDRESPEARPQARYPAALDSVLGVGALPKDRPASGDLRTATYSNLADKPPRRPKIGITTLGGEKGVAQGVLGLYLGEFPNGAPNKTKWAWWAGTSFATPIISGVLAAMLSGTPGSTTQQAIAKLYTSPTSPVMEKTTDNEDALFVTQS